MWHLLQKYLFNEMASQNILHFDCNPYLNLKTLLPTKFNWITQMMGRSCPKNYPEILCQFKILHGTDHLYILIPKGK